MKHRSATLPPYRKHDSPKSSDATCPIDTFIAAVPLDENRCILVYRRQHGEPPVGYGDVIARERLGGVLRHYARAAV